MSTRTEACCKQQELHPGKMLPQICLEMRMAINGAGDPWSDDLLLDTVKMLTARVETWERGLRPSLVDDYVFVLMGATLMECQVLWETRRRSV